MKKLLFPIAAFAFLAVLAGSSIAQQGEKTYQAEPTPVALAQREVAQGEKRIREETTPTSGGELEAYAAEKSATAAPNFGYISSGGSFDLTRNGVFQYIYGPAGTTVWVEKTTFHNEDANFWYYREVRNPTWFWAFDKQPLGDGGRFRIFIQPGTGDMKPFSRTAVRGPVNKAL